MEIRVMDGSFSNSWEELFATLMAKYKECKGLKQDAADDKWAVWSGQFNRHCNGLETSTAYGPTSRIFQIWATFNRLLTCHKLLVSTSHNHGQDGRQNINKIINENIKILKQQKMVFWKVCR